MSSLGAAPARRRSRVKSISTAACICAVVVIAGCADRVTIMGDSITALTDSQLDSSLDSYRVDARAEFGARVVDMMPAARDAARAAPEVVVINLGSNDVLHGSSISDAASELVKMIGLFGSAECVVMVNVNTNMVRDEEQMGDRAASLNREIDQIAASDDRVEIVDWAQMTESDITANRPTGTFTDDTVHPTQVGAAALAGAIGATVNRCAPDRQS